MKKGTTNNPNGRAKGVPNKSTTLAREALAKFVDNNTDKLEEWLVQIAADNPKDAFDCVIKVMEYHLPKLARVDSNVSLDGKVTIVVNSNIPYAPNQKPEKE